MYNSGEKRFSYRKLTKAEALKIRKERHKEACKKYVEKNKDKVRASKAAYRDSHRQILRDKNKVYYRTNDRGRVAIHYKREKKKRAIDYLGGICKDCKGAFPDVCYDFHHKNPKSKIIEVCQILTSSWEVILVELKKCVLLCSNCHRIRHQKEADNKAKKRKK